jgi:hypothetical protein
VQIAIVVEGEAVDDPRRVLSMASVAGGSLAILLAIGYLSQSEGRSRGWPFVAIVGVLIAANVVLRAIRARR